MRRRGTITLLLMLAHLAFCQYLMLSLYFVNFLNGALITHENILHQDIVLAHLAFCSQTTSFHARVPMWVHLAFCPQEM